jgi:DNA primase catalytic core
MAGFLGDDQVRRVKDAIDIVQLMGEYAALRKSGKTFACCCPFHQERSPSCYVYPDTQSYYCFGCQAHGDAISLIRAKENVSFTDAIELLARRAGIQLVYENGKGQNRGERDAFIAACNFASQFYEKCLWEDDGAAAARAYLLERRQLAKTTCERFRLGWAPGRGTLVEAAKRKGIDPQLLARLDLAVERDGRLVDRFYERVMFPICDRFGNPLAFSARLLPEAEKAAKEAGRGVGKYVNNTDTPLYHKGSTVFNLHRARTVARDAGRLIVMEGPTDVMAADQAGIGECVAVLGTALTPEHAKQLGALVGDKGRLLLLLDGDRAGQTNALKGIRTCLAVGVPVRVAILPDEMDPSELLAEGPGGVATPEAKATFEKVLAGARADVDHLLRASAPRPYDLARDDLVRAVDEILAAVRPMPDPEQRTLALEEVGQWFNLPKDRLAKRLVEGAPAPAAAAPAGEPTAPVLELPSPAAEVVLHLLVAHPSLRAIAADDFQLEPSHLPAPWDALLGALLALPEADPDAICAAEGVLTHEGLQAAVRRWAATPVDARLRRNTAPRPEGEDLRPELENRVRQLRRAGLDAAIHRLGAEIKDSEKARDFARIKVLMTERSELQRQARDLA